MNKKAQARHMRGEDAMEESPKGGTVSPTFTHEAYIAELRLLQIELVKLQRHFTGYRDKILILLEGRKVTAVEVHNGVHKGTCFPFTDVTQKVLP